MNKLFRDTPHFADLKRRGSKAAKANASVFVISGESLTMTEIAQRLGGIDRKQANNRLIYARRRLKDGERLTWEALAR